MHIILILLISLPVFANRFTLKETGARFDLAITPELLSFHSESSRRTIPLKVCSQSLASILNAELISKLPSVELAEGLKFYVDEKEIVIDSKSDLAKTILMIDARILRFVVEEKEACK